MRKLVKDGVEWVKTYPTGDAAAPDANDHHTLCMTFDEMHAVVAKAHNHRMKVTGHCRATARDQERALRAGFDTLEHGTFMDDEALDMLLAADTPVVPAFHFEWRASRGGPNFGMSHGGHRRPQGDAGGGRESAANDSQGRRPPRHGRRLRLRLEPPRRLRQGADLFRQLRRFPPLETITCATATGAEIMGLDDEFGTVDPGKLADLLIVDGDVLADIAMLEDRARLLAVVQGGIVKAGRLANNLDLGESPGICCAVRYRAVNRPIQAAFFDSPRSLCAAVPARPRSRVPTPRPMEQPHDLCMRAWHLVREPCRTNKLANRPAAESAKTSCNPVAAPSVACPHPTSRPPITAPQAVWPGDRIEQPKCPAGFRAGASSSGTAFGPIKRCRKRRPAHGWAQPPQGFGEASSHSNGQATSAIVAHRTMFRVPNRSPKRVHSRVATTPSPFDNVRSNVTVANESCRTDNI